MAIDQEILLNILALDKGFEEFEFIHSYLGPLHIKRRARDISVQKAYKTLQEIRKNQLSSVSDDAPWFRRTYIQDLIDSVLAQVDFFVFHKRPKSFQSLVEKLQGFKTPTLFNLKDAFQQTQQELRKIGFSSIADCQSQRHRETFKNRAHLSRHIRQIIHQHANLAAKKYTALFGFDVKKLLDKTHIKIERSGKNDPPCYYIYKGKYRGLVGLTLKNEYHTGYLEGFICHEVIPGHHLYYMIKEQCLTTQKHDAIFALDPFYSPENVINEGLAVNADLILGDLLDPMVVGLLKIGKFLHKFFHNAWYCANIQKKTVGKAYYNLLTKEFGFSASLAKARIHYYTHEAKYYIPCYPLGAYYVEQVIIKHGPDVIPFLYSQHSLNTLNKLSKHLYEHKH